MGIPALIGAGIGGAMSSARGGNPLTGALLGGVTGGVGGSILGSASELAKTAALNTATNPANYLSPTSFMGVASQVPSALGSYVSANPMSTLSLANSLMPQEQQMPMAQSQGLLRGNQMQPQGQQYQVDVPRISLI
jgi:hypothetical protein